MQIDQLILWLSKCGVQKVIPVDGVATIPKGDKSFYRTDKGMDLILGELTTIDIVLFPAIQFGPEFDPSRFCSVQMAATTGNGVVVSSSWWAEHDEVPYHRDFTEFGSINSVDDLYNYLKKAMGTYQVREDELTEMLFNE